MPEYTDLIAEQIAEALRLRGRIEGDQLPGLSAEVGADFLRRYHTTHAGAEGLSFDGRVLALTSPDGATYGSSQEPPQPVPPASSSPVDQVLAMAPQRGLLETTPSEAPVSKMMWLLPILLGFVGGLIAWVAVKDDSPRTGRLLMWVGVIITVVSVLVPMAFGGVLGVSQMVRAPSGAGGSADIWPASTTGRPVFYYFGTDT